MIKSFVLVTPLLCNMLLVFCPHIDLISCLCVCACALYQRVFWRLWVFMSLLTRGSDYLCTSSAAEVEPTAGNTQFLCSAFGYCGS